jgi:hypothetical protein
MIACLEPPIRVQELETASFNSGLCGVAAGGHINPYLFGRISNAEREGVDQATSAQQLLRELGKRFSKESSRTVLFPS